jgi:hypothetical protein
MEHFTFESETTVDHAPGQDEGTVLHSKDGNPEDERPAETGEEGMQRDETLHSSKAIFDMPPYDWDRRCHCCGRHVSELVPYGGPDDPLIGDYTGALLVKQCRPMFDTRTEEEAL